MGSAWRRVGLVYLGAVGVWALLLPFAMRYTLGGHSLMLTGVYGSGVGVLLGTWCADRLDKVRSWRVIAGSLVAVIIFVAWVVFVASLEAQLRPILGSIAWVLIPALGPLVVALPGAQIARGRAR